jgi:hypothetical protein
MHGDRLLRRILHILTVAMWPGTSDGFLRVGFILCVLTLRGSRVLKEMTVWLASTGWNRCSLPVASAGGSTVSTYCHSGERQPLN